MALIIGNAERLHSRIRLFDEYPAMRCSSHHESREAAPIVQAALVAGIAASQRNAGVARFGTVPDAMIVIGLQLACGLALNPCAR